MLESTSWTRHDARNPNTHTHARTNSKQRKCNTWPSRGRTRSLKTFYSLRRPSYTEETFRAHLRGAADRRDIRELFLDRPTPRQVASKSLYPQPITLRPPRRVPFALLFSLLFVGARILSISYHVDSPPLRVYHRRPLPSHNAFHARTTRRRTFCTSFGSGGSDRAPLLKRLLVFEAHVVKEGFDLPLVRRVELLRQLLHARGGRVRVLVINLSQLYNHLRGCEVRRGELRSLGLGTTVEGVV